MPTFTPPVAQMVIPRYLPDSSALEVRMWRHFRPLDQGVNTFILFSPSNDTFSVVTDLPVLGQDGINYTSTAIPYPWITGGGYDVARTIPLPSFGGEGIPFAQSPPYSVAQNMIAQSGGPGTAFQEFLQDPYIYTFFLGGHAPYVISAACATILENNNLGNYVS